MELLRWTIFYLSILSITVVLASLGWRIGGKLKRAKQNARLKKDQKELNQFEDL